MIEQSWGELDSKHEKTIVTLVDETFGGEGYGIDVVSQIKSQEEPLISLCWNENQMIGFGFSFIALPEQAPDFARKHANDVSNSLAQPFQIEKTGILKTVCTLPAFQRQGVGTRIIEAITKSLHQRGVTDVLVPCWELDGVVNLKKALVRKGFRFLNRDDFYWREACDRGEFKCEGRTESCHCHAVWYGKSM